MMYNVNLANLDLKKIEAQVEELFKNAPNHDALDEQFNQTFPEANSVKLPSNLAKASSASLLKKFNNLTTTQLYDVFAKIVYIMQNEEAEHLLARLQKYMLKHLSDDSSSENTSFVFNGSAGLTIGRVIFEDTDKVENEQKQDYVSPNVEVNEIEHTVANINIIAPEPAPDNYVFDYTDDLEEEETFKSTLWQRIRFWFYSLFN